MSHGISQTRRQRNTGKVSKSSARKSRDKKFHTDYSGQHPPLEAVQQLERFWNRLSHEWLRTNEQTFPYNMNKWKKKEETGTMLTSPSSGRGR